MTAATIAAAAAAEGINMDVALSQLGGIFTLGEEQRAALGGFYSVGNRSLFALTPD